MTPSISCATGILRELQALIEIDGRTWAARMRHLLLDANAVVNKAREAGEQAMLALAT